MENDKFKNYSEASKLRQSLIPKSVRSARMRKIALLKWKNVSPEDRRLHSLKMVKARQTPHE